LTLSLRVGHGLAAMAATLSRSEKLDWLQLARCDGVGPRTFFKLLKRFGSAARAYAELPRLAAESGNPERWRRCPRQVAEAELAAIEALGAHLMAHGEPTYPQRLAEIADPPPVLMVRGDPALLAQAAVAVVGARNASGSGRTFARHLAGELAGGGIVIVSGLARGIDTAAHDGALAAGGTTVAVLACGVDVAYPPDNAKLLGRIVEAGAVVSERPLGAEPQARHFPKRNRLIAGLSLGVVVVEAAPQSGSLITARLAAEQGREVMAVPGSPLDPRHRGTNQLLREGAALVESAEDVRAALGSALQPAPAPRRRPLVPAPPPSAPAPAPATNGTGLDRLICERLGPVPLLVDELIRQCDGRAAEVQRTLLELELSGRIERHPGNRVALVAG
jgi:DNA processing protein